MDISERLRKMLSGMESRDAELLREVIGNSVEALQTEESEEELRKKFEETRARIKEIEAKALRKLERSKNNPMCSFCLSKLDNVTHMIKAQNNSTHICDKCIVECYEKFQILKKP